VREETERIRALGLDGNAEKLLIAHLDASHGLDAEAIELLEELSKGSAPPAVQRSLGDLYARAGLHRLAEERYLKAAQLAEGAGDREGQALARQSLGVLYREAFGLEDEAKRAFGAALELFRALGDTVAAQQVEEQLAHAKNP
jgi:tetratricopeptide (TPR) repeat protein